MNRPEILIRPSTAISRNVIAVVDDLGHYSGHPEKTGKHIHRIRVDIKRLRAWIRLVRSHGDKQEWREIDRSLRDIAKQLSEKRDEQIIPTALLWLKKKSANRDEAVSINSVHSHLQAVSAAHPLSPEKTGMPDRYILETLNRKTLSAVTCETIRDGLRKTYKRALQLGAKACADKGTVSDLHRFRRWVKYLCYQLEFIDVLYDGDYEKIRFQLDKLGKRLGRIHDLVLVKNRLKRLSGAENYKKDVRKTGIAADRKIRKLVKQAKRSFNDIFVLNPREFAAGLHRL